MTSLADLRSRGWGWLWRVEIDLSTAGASETLVLSDASAGGNLPPGNQSRVEQLGDQIEGAVVEWQNIYRPRAGTLRPGFGDSDVAITLGARAIGERAVKDRSVHDLLGRYPIEHAPMRVYARPRAFLQAGEVKIFDGIIDRLEGIRFDSVTIRGRGSPATDHLPSKLVNKDNDGTDAPRTTDEGTYVPIVVGRCGFSWVEFAHDKGGIATTSTAAREAFAQIPSRTTAPVTERGGLKVRVSSGEIDETPIDVSVPALLAAWPDDNLRPLSFPDIGATQISESLGYLIINGANNIHIPGDNAASGVVCRRLYSPQSIAESSRGDWSTWENVLDGLDLDGYTETDTSTLLMSAGRILNGPTEAMIINDDRSWWICAIVQLLNDNDETITLRIHEDVSHSNDQDDFDWNLTDAGVHLLASSLNSTWQNRIAGRPNWGQLAGDWIAVKGSGNETVRVHALAISAPSLLRREQAHFRGRGRGRSMVSESGQAGSTDVYQDERPSLLYYHGWGPSETTKVGQVITDLLIQGTTDALDPIVAGDIETGTNVYGSMTDLDTDLGDRIDAISGGDLAFWNCFINDRTGRPLREILSQLAREFLGHIWRDPADGKYKAVALGPLAGHPTPFTLHPDDCVNPPVLTGGDADTVRNAVYVRHKRADGTEGREVWIDGDDNLVRDYTGAGSATLQGRAQDSIDLYGRRVEEIDTAFVSDPAAMFELCKRTFDQRVVPRFRMDVELRGDFLTHQCGERFETTAEWDEAFYEFPSHLTTIGWRDLEWTILSADPTPEGTVRVTAEWSDQLVI